MRCESDSVEVYACRSNERFRVIDIGIGSVWYGKQLSLAIRTDCYLWTARQLLSLSSFELLKYADVTLLSPVLLKSLLSMIEGSAKAICNNGHILRQSYIGLGVQ